MNTSPTYRYLRSLSYPAATMLCILLSFLGCSFQFGSAAPVAPASVEASGGSASVEAYIAPGAITALDSDVVYMLDDDGQPVEQPNACIQQPVVYTDTTLSVVLGYIDPSTDNIEDAYGNVVGYVSPSGDGFP